LWVRQDLPRHLHRLLLYERQLAPLGDYLPPLVDLLVDVDLDRADAGTTAVECRGERQRAVFAQIEGGIDDHADRSRIGCAVGEAAAAPVHRTSVHARAAADTLERIPEIRHAQPLRAPVVNQDDVHFSAVARGAE